MLGLYTLICEYGGGTYIAQMNASSPKKAILFWLDGLGSGNHIPKDVRQRIKVGLSDDSLVAISDCRNVWCCSASAKKGLVLINLVRTSSTSRRAS